ncbi:MAG: prolipoprotein diacylglyceryl transferase [Clostridia bacterium]|nr:prolipoprotein diacylglyceryl transferase [Clostridia bacterium]
MMNGFLSLYGLSLLLLAFFSWDLLETSISARGLLKRTCAVLYTLGLVLIAAGARGFYLLFDPFGLQNAAWISLWPYEYAVSGAVLGAIAAGLLTALVTRQSAGYVLDAMTPTAMIVLALARCAEAFADFGWGAVVEGEWARFPFAVKDMFGQPRSSVFFLSALLILLALAYAKAWRKRMPGELFSIALCWLAMGQLFCETLRSESICWGFVRVQQIAWAVMALGVLVGWNVKNHLGGRQLRNGLLIYMGCIGAIVFAQYAMDKLTHVLPRTASYGLMGAALLVMGVVVQRTVCASPQKLLVKVRYKKEA